MKRVDHFVNGDQTVFFRDIGEMSVTSGGVGVGMAQQALDMPKAYAAFKQMGSVTVPERVDGDFFLMPHSATTFFMATCTPPRSIWVVAR